MGNLNNNWQSQVAKINLKNVSGQTIPPYACCELEYDEAGSATEMNGDEIVFRVTLPTADGVADSARIVFNGAGKIQDEAVGIGVICPLIQSLWDYTTDPEIGQSCGATEDEWYLSAGGSGFTFKSVDATEAYTDDSVVDVKTAFFERAGGSGTIKYAYPPSGGLPAASYNATTEELAPSSTSCELAELSGGVYQRSGSSVAVENPVGVIVGASGKPITIGKTAYGKWTVLVEDCSSADEGGGGDPNPEPPVPDAIDSGTSKGIDMGYSMGV